MIFWCPSISSASCRLHISILETKNPGEWLHPNFGFSRGHQLGHPNAFSALMSQWAIPKPGASDVEKMIKKGAINVCENQ